MLRIECKRLNEEKELSMSYLVDNMDGVVV